MALRYDKRKNRTQSLLEANPITLFAVSLDQILDQFFCIIATRVTTPKMLFYFLLNKMFVFTTTLKPFGTEMCVAKM